MIRLLKKILPETILNRIIIKRRDFRSSSWHFKKIASVGKGTTYEKGFKIYNGHKNIQIGNNVFLVDTLLNAGDDLGSITIGNSVTFGHRVMVLARGHEYKKNGKERQQAITEKPIRIEDDAWIGSGSILLAGIIIGKGSVVGAGSVVTKNIPPKCIYAGNPAKLIKKL
ncbi:DapH/DapD/GlmU-related protein [Leptospira sp. WS92.C1]